MALLIRNTSASAMPFFTESPAVPEMKNWFSM